MTPDLSFLIGVARGVLLSLRCTCHVSAFGFLYPIRYTISRMADANMWKGCIALRTPQRGDFGQILKILYKSPERARPMCLVVEFWALLHRTQRSTAPEL